VNGDQSHYIWEKIVNLKNNQLGCYVISNEPMIITSNWHDFLQNKSKLQDVFILPLIHELFVIVVLEAWASGLFVITSGVGGIKRLLSNNKTGLVFDDKLDDLERKYHLLVNNPELMKELKQNALDMVKTEYSWTSVTAKLIDDYDEIIEKFRN